MLIFDDIADKIKDRAVSISVNGNAMHKRIPIETAKICYGGNKVTGIYAKSNDIVIEVHSPFVDREDENYE